MKRRVHFIAIGGSAMHNLAIALQKKDYIVTGSDDEIFEPARGNLLKYGILPESIGWDANKINTDIDEIILGMHARADNPELLKAQELGLKIYSYPEYLYEQSKDKVRVVIGGSHGKTTITAMILHVLAARKIDCDYMVGAKLEGFEVMVKLTKEAKIMIIEGDEYLTSPIDRRPKFHLYMPNIALISGIAWDHINVFPTFEIYVEQFQKFIELIDKNGSLIYCENDSILKDIAKKTSPELHKIPYDILPYSIDDKGTTSIKTTFGDYKLKVFGEHNLSNINGAKQVCNQLGISDKDFFEAIISFPGASNRLELVEENNETKIFKDFAHSPSKLKATTKAVKQQFKNHKLVAAMELHTFSSLNSEFLNQYAGAMDSPDIALVYYNPHTIEHKMLKAISKEDVKNAFKRDDLLVFTDSVELKTYLLNIDYSDKNLLLMSSGNFDGINLKEFAENILKNNINTINQ
ncbi:MAG: peptidoglycan synthetase [Bacteroidetes bacterium CG2_30_33_31]|nr:MAG: peptidoglycan synthetase [Bacteroidetes bacterium CG2_30_33_31]